MENGGNGEAKREREEHKVLSPFFSFSLPKQTDLEPAFIKNRKVSSASKKEKPFSVSDPILSKINQTREEHCLHSWHNKKISSLGGGLSEARRRSHFLTFRAWRLSTSWERIIPKYNIPCST
jgi:hypothetical protein